MKISIRQSGKPLLIELLCEEEEWKVVHLSIFGKRPSIKGEDLQACEDKFNELEYKGAKKFVFRRLAKRNYHSAEVKAFLAERRVAYETIAKILIEFQQSGYINDADWCDSFVKSLQRQKYGPKSIAMKLRGRGISEEEAEAAIAANCDTHSQKMNIQRLLATRYRSRKLDEPKEKQKIVAALVRKGYHFKEIFESLENMPKSI